MGISRAAVHFMLTEAKSERFQGRLLTFGVQQTAISEKELINLARKTGYELSDVDETKVEKLDRHQHLTDLYLFRRLGFDEIIRTDVSDFQGAELVFDLNDTNFPEEYAGYFDMVLDGGTIEHVFHVPNSLRNIFLFLKVGGRVMHSSPSSNNVDHGFYMFSPTLFWDYYEANKFEFRQFKFFEYNRWGNTQNWIAADYQPGCLRYVSGGGLPRGQYGILVVAKKGENSSCDVVPQQHRYAKTWARTKKRKSSRSMWVRRSKKRAEQLWKRVGVRGFPLRITNRY